MNSPGEDESGERTGATGGGAARSVYTILKKPKVSTCNYRERNFLQEKARCARAEGPTNNRQSVKAVKAELSQLKKHTLQRPMSDTRPPDSFPDPPGPEASSWEAQAAGLPPLPDLTLSPPPPSLLSYRAGGPIRLRQSQHSLHRY